MSDLNMTLEEFNKLVPSLCRKETAAGGGQGWTPDNPTWGHCAVVSLLAQNLFGGTLLRVSLEGTEFAEARSHYYNLPHAIGYTDFTEAQFRGRLQTSTLAENAEERTREYVINGADTKERYAKLALRFIDTACDDPMMANSLYRECIFQALQSPCQKMGKGAVITDGDGRIVSSDCNRTIDELKDVCTPECIRFQIASRTESMIGSCGHAEERLLWRFVHELGYSASHLSRMHMYVAGVDSDGIPHNERQLPEFTCLRCAVQLAYAHIGSVNVVFQGAWHRQSPEEALQSSKAYALGDKTV